MKFACHQSAATLLFMHIHLLCNKDDELYIKAVRKHKLFYQSQRGGSQHPQTFGGPSTCAHMV